MQLCSLKAAQETVLESAISIRGLKKIFPSGLVALEDVNLEIRPGEIFALLGPNGAGKTTLINIVCGVTKPTSGEALVFGHDVSREPRMARSVIGLVPQDFGVELFDTVWSAVKFSRGLFGKAPNPAFLDSLLRSLALSDHKNCATVALSGGMKRRLMVAKALSHEPRILFLDEPTAGVDVELRRSTWSLVKSLRNAGATVILTTHYIDEAEELADRVGIIRKGKIVLVENKETLMRELGKESLTLRLREPLSCVPPALSQFLVNRSADGCELIFRFDRRNKQTVVNGVLHSLSEPGAYIEDLVIENSSLEDILVSVMR